MRERTVTDLETTALTGLHHSPLAAEREGAVAAVRELARQLDAAHDYIERIAEASGEPKPGQLLHERIRELARRAGPQDA